MNEEEKNVINEFEGEEEYTKVFNNTKYYLFKENNAILLETC